MGAVSPNSKVGDRMRDNIERQVLLPTLHGMNYEGRPFQGILFAGLILTVAGPKVLEYNVRFGDPECQVLMMRMQSDILPPSSVEIQEQLMKARLIKNVGT